MALTDHIIRFSDTIKPLISIKDDDIDNTSTSLTLCPYNSLNYTNVLNNSTLKLMEHFCGPTEPNNPTYGQLWVDTSGAPDEPDRLKVYINQKPGALKFMDVAGTVIRRSGSLRHTGQIEAFDNYNGIPPDVNYTTDAGTTAHTCPPHGTLTPDSDSVNVSIPAPPPSQVYVPPTTPPPPAGGGTGVVTAPDDTSIPTVTPYTGTTVPATVTGTLTDLTEMTPGATYIVKAGIQDVSSFVTSSNRKDWSLDTSTLGWTVPSTHSITVYRYESSGSSKANTDTNQIVIQSSVPVTTIVKPMKLRIVGDRRYESTLTPDLSDFTAAGLTIDGPPLWDFNFPWAFTGTDYVVPSAASTPGRSRVLCSVRVNGKFYGAEARGNLSAGTTPWFYPTGPFWISGDTTAGTTLTADSSGVQDADGIVGGFHYTWKNDGQTVGTDSNTYVTLASDVGHTISCILTWTCSQGQETIESDNFVTLTAP